MTTTFLDTTKHQWDLALTVDRAERVCANCRDKNNEPLDLFAMAEKGDFRLIEVNYKALLQLIFVLLEDEIYKSFDLDSWNQTHRTEYLAYPNLATESVRQKAARWFGERMDGTTTAQAVDALEVALINFIPDTGARVIAREASEAQRNLIMESLLNNAQVKLQET